MLHLFRLLGGLLGLLTPKLRGGRVLLGLLRTADGADAGNGVFANVTTVAVLSSEVGNTLVNPDFQVSHLTPVHSLPARHPSNQPNGSNIHPIKQCGVSAYLRLEDLGPQFTLTKVLAGCWGLVVFLVVATTPPSSVA